MQHQTINPSLALQCALVSDTTATELRQHPGAREVGYGWLRIARAEYFVDRVLLVSTSAPVSVTFRHGPTRLDQIGASLCAALYAYKNPQQPIAAAS